jgi:hypothetical protein
MGDWCTDLFGRLQKRGLYNAAETLGLRQLDSPEQFEERIGRFLAWQRSLTISETLMDLGTPLAGPPVPGQVTTWFRDAKAMADQITDEIHQSLFALFSKSKLSDYACRDAYQALLSTLDIGQATPIAYATTNYDVAGETWLGMCERHPDWGEPAGFNVAEAPIRVRGLASVMSPYRVPVLHLHGRVGWYLRDGNLISVNPDSPYQPRIGQPGLLLPDPGKDYAELPALAEMWDEFKQLIARVSHVIVIGHSLHDSRLVGYLREAQNLAVSVYQDERAAEAGARVNELLPSATVVPMAFGPQCAMQVGDLEPWLQA